ncbi:hypothetical protein MLD38_007073 [Melastoma candidum]|uniref:Uncharacterized protein n=1 Tax=Melastoma candidum TaxID=119954 RepID=A0ACB9RQG7_9MYRT|nr:hypothetical protein MLD38_007073 [Melastoma candidum]
MLSGVEGQRIGSFKIVGIVTKPAEDHSLRSRTMEQKVKKGLRIVEILISVLTLLPISPPHRVTPILKREAETVAAAMEWGSSDFLVFCSIQLLEMLAVEEPWKEMLPYDYKKEERQQELGFRRLASMYAKTYEEIG